MLICIEATGHFRGTMGRQERGEWGLSRVRGVKNYKNRRGLVPMKPIWCLSELGSSLPKEAVG